MIFFYTDSSLLTSFSIARNYRKIIACRSNKQEEANDLQFTYFFRVFTMFFIIWGHALMILTAVPVENPEFIEKHLYQPVTILFQNGTALIQIFFVLAGFLLKLKFEQQQLITPKSGYFTCILMYIQVFIQRYLRFVFIGRKP